MSAMRVISWNIAGWTRRSPGQAESLKVHNPDIVGLQEVTDGSWNVLREELISAGLIYSVYSREIIAECSKKKAVAVFSRWPLTILEEFLDVPYPELTLSMLIHTPCGDIQFHCVHIPNGSSHGWEKIDSFEAVYSKLAQSSKLPRILCGDFNSPKEELDNGDIIPWSRPSPRWSQGELSVISGLSEYDLPDIYRRLNGYPPKDFSWYWRDRGRRFDHIFASAVLNPFECQYIHEWRTGKLSDHSAIEAVFKPL